MRSGVGARHLALMVGVIAFAGCITVGPAPLLSDDSYRFGVAARAFHRDISEVAEATLEAMRDISLGEIEKVEEVGKTRIDAFTSDHRRVRVDLEWKTGTPEGTPLPLVGVITSARVKVGDSGDRDLSRTLLDRIAYHLQNPPLSNATEK